MRSDKALSSVLIIDDDEIEVMLYSRLCKRSDVVGRIDAIHDPEAALEHLLSLPKVEYDLIFVDYNMPCLDGIELLQMLQEKSDHPVSKANIVMLTSSICPADEAAARGCSLLSDFITKPLTEDMLFKLAQRYGSDGGVTAQSSPAA